MSNLSAFLNPAVPAEEKEVIISNRFQENGKPVPFKIRALTQEEMDGIIKQATRMTKVKRQQVEQLDKQVMSRLVVLTGTVEPNFANKQLCDKYGVIDPSLVPGKMLLAGEHTRLSEAIMELSGFDYDEEVEEQAKN